VCLAVDDAGDALAVWEENLPPTSRQRVRASHRAADAHWSYPLAVEDNPHKTVELVRPGLDAAGNVVVIWRQCSQPDDGTPYSVWTNRYESGVGWNTALQLSDPQHHASYPCLAVTPAGETLAVWKTGEIMTRRYTPASGWGVAQAIHSDVTEQFGYLHLAQNAAGQAVVAWWQNDRMWFNYYDPQMGWTGSAPYDQSPAPWTVQDSIRLVLDTAGVATAVWIDDQVHAARYVPGAGWTADVVLASGDPDARAEVTLDRTDNVHVVWTTPFGSTADICEVHFSYYNPERGWSVPEVLGVAGAVVGYAVDPLGNGVLVLTSEAAIGPDLFVRAGVRSDATVGVWTRRFVADAGWTDALRIDPSGATATNQPAIFIDASGRATVVWRQDWQEVWACRFE
jgi:hypothetical protein